MKQQVPIWLVLVLLIVSQFATTTTLFLILDTIGIMQSEINVLHGNGK